MPKIARRALNLLLLLLVLVLVVALLANDLLRPRLVSPPVLSGSLSEQRLSWAGRERSYLLYTPKTLAARPALVVAYHGSLGTGADMREQTGQQFDRLADQHGFIVAYPSGVDRHWNDCRGSAAYEANILNIDDVGFSRALVQQLSAQYGVNTEAVFATGYSNGGHMTYRLAFEAPGLFRAIAPLAANIPAAVNNDCRLSGVPSSVMIINGSEDRVNPYEGGLVSLLGDDSRGEVKSSRYSAEYFAAIAGIDSEPAVAQLPDSDDQDGGVIERLRWQGQGQAVELLTVRGGGHSFPSKVVKFGPLLGGNNRDAETAELLWEFFQSVSAE